MKKRSAVHIVLTVVLCASALSVAALSDGASDAARKPPSMSSLEHRVQAMTRQARAYEQTRKQMYRWWRCIRPLRVDRAGDPQHGWGFEFDERDGTGVDMRPALVRRESKGRPDLLLLRFKRTNRCVTMAPDPNGTGEDARAAAEGARTSSGSVSRRGGGAMARLGRLEHRLERLMARINRLEDAFDRFDEWESCLSWLPVTEYGHVHQKLGYLYGGQAAPTYLGALDIDESEWDDPDYELLAFIGRDRPFKRVECGHEPGESVDRGVSPRTSGTIAYRGSEQWSDRLDDVRGDIHAAQEDMEDLLEPVQEFVQFDECMFTVGVRNLGSSAGGYRFVAPTGARTQRAALSFDMTGLQLPQWDVMAFPGEEPPQIECNEDAGGQNTDE